MAAQVHRGVEQIYKLANASQAALTDHIFN